MLQQKHADFGKRYAAGTALQKLRTEAPLQPCHRLGKSRLTDCEFVCSSDKTACITYLYKGFQVINT